MSNQLLQDSDMVYVRAEAEKLLPDTCTILTVQRIEDGRGGQTEEWAESYQNVPCRFAENSGHESKIAEALQVTAQWILSLPYDQTVDESMRVSHKAHTYEVVFVNSDRSHDTVRRCYLRRVD